MRNFIKYCFLFTPAIISLIGCSNDNPVISSTPSTWEYRVGIYLEDFSSELSNFLLTWSIKTKIRSLGSYNAYDISDGLITVAGEGAVNFDDLDSFAIINQLNWVVYIIKTNGSEDKYHYSIWCLKRDLLNNIFEKEFYWTELFDSTASENDSIAGNIISAITNNVTETTYLRSDQYVAYLQVPELVKAVMSEYPNTTDDGKVYPQLLIDSTGDVACARLAKADSNYLFNEAALRAVKQYVFTPAIDSNGVPSMCWVIVPIIFNYDKIVAENLHSIK